jgi:hypothetical protein
MDAFKRNFLRHALAVRQWMERRRARGNLDPLTFELEVTCDDRTVKFWPCFMESSASGDIQFAPTLGPKVTGFVSWKPYRSKAWPIAQDKLAFKDFAREHGVPTPEHAAAALPVPYLVKARRSSLGAGQRGPFPAGAPVELVEGEYCERFIFGSLVKAWFWNTTLIAAEVVEMPTLVGDGKRPLRQLLRARLGLSAKLPERIHHLAALQGLDLDRVVPHARKVVADYQYMSPMNPSITRDYNVRDELKGTSVGLTLEAAGRACVLGIPEAMRADTVFSLDGVVDSSGQLWFLEANCNPLLHPACYEHLLEALFPR